MMSNLQKYAKPKGFCLVLSAPSGTGKTTVSGRLLGGDSSIARSISMTTRPQRPGEVDGRDYLFISEAHFRSLIEQKEFLEWAEVHGELYGTPRSSIERIIAEGRVALLVIDVQGGVSVKALFPDAVLVFLLPPSIDHLEQRLRGRGTEPDAGVKRRLNEALNEMQYVAQYTYCVVNEEGRAEQAVETIQAIITAERRRVSRWEV